MVKPISQKVSYRANYKVNSIRFLNIHKNSNDKFTNKVPTFNGKYLDAINLSKKKLISGFKLSRYLLSPSAMKSIIHDPKAFFYTYKEELGLIRLWREKLGKIDVASRKNHKKTPVTVVKETFDRGLEKYSIEKFAEKLAYVYVSEVNKKEIFIEYLTNVVGSSRYKNLEQCLLQVVVEDSINKGVLPKIIAIPHEIGANQFSRSTLYKMMGADVSPVTVFNSDEVKLVDVLTVTPEKIAEKMKRKQEKGKLLFPQTELNLKKLIPVK